LSQPDIGPGTRVFLKPTDSDIFLGGLEFADSVYRGTVVRDRPDGLFLIQTDNGQWHVLRRDTFDVIEDDTDNTSPWRNVPYLVGAILLTLATVVIFGALVH